MIIRHLGIDCAYINKVLEPITQREHGVTEFEIEIKNHGADIDLSECTLATYYGLKPDEHKVGVECRVDKDKGLIYLPLYLQMTTAEGVLKGIVELQFPEGNVRFSGVNFKVSFAPDDTKVESTDDFNILENFISKPTTDGVVGQVLSIDNDGNTIWRTLKEFDGDYAHLSNRPSINGVELNGDKSLEDLNIKQTYTADDIPFVDGETFQQKFNNGELKGQDGVSGADGITPHIGDNGNWFIGETDTNKPSQGTNGVNGNDGVGVAKSEVNTNGELVITYSNGDSINLGKIVGKDGLDGKNGTDGKTPVKGTDYFTAEDKSEFTAEVTESLKPEFLKKQDKLTAGENITISDDGTISATNGVKAVEEALKTATAELATVKSEVETARGSSSSLNARLNGIDSSVTNKAEKSTVSQLSVRMQTAETSLAGKANATDVNNALKAKENNANKVSSKTDITDSSVNYPSIEYLNEFYYNANELYSSEETDELLGNKANVNSVYSKAETDNLLGEKAGKADVDDVKAYIGYTDEDIAGLCVDYENKTFKRLAGAVNLSQGVDFNKFEMYGGRRRCNVLDDGTITAYYGDENYVEDGSNGQVMVFQPKFYYKVVPLKLEKNTDSGIGFHLRKANYYVSSKPKTGFKLHPAFYDENGNAINYILFSADEGSMYDVSAKAYVNDNVDESITYEDGDLLCSVAGKKPISGLRQGIGTKANLELMAQNRGSGWHLETIEVISANQLLMIIELGIMSTQNGIGRGVVSITGNTAYNCSSLTGSTADLGNATGQAVKTINEIGGTQTIETANGKVSVSYRGIENPWGNISKHIQGINIWGDGSMCGGQLYVANDFAFNESKHSDNYEPVGFTLSNANGYIKAMGYGSEKYDWLFMPSEIGGTSALPVGDYIYVALNLNGYRIIQLGGGCRSGDYAGGFYQIANGTVGDRSRGAGGRLLYVPTAKV